MHALVIDIGAGTADFCVMQGRYPTEEDQKTLPNAGDSIDEQLVKLIRERHPEAQFSIHMLREWKEKWSFVGEPKDHVMVTVPIKGKATRDRYHAGNARGVRKHPAAGVRDDDDVADKSRA